jgi:hypothetical protein
MANQQMMMGMMNPQGDPNDPNGGGQVDENGNPIEGGGEVDENGNPVEGGEEGAPPQEASEESGPETQFETQDGEEEAPAKEESEGGEEAAPAEEGGSEEERAVEAAVMQYLEDHPELQKSLLEKSADPAKTHEELEKIRNSYLRAYDLTQKMMLRDVFKELKKELSDEPSKDK